MKRKKNKRTFWRSTFAALIFGVFIYIGLASLGGSQQSRHIGNGVYETAKYYGNGNVEVVSGKQDGRGNYHGQITITLEKDGVVTEKEEVTMINGVRHGQSRMTYQNGSYDIICYDQGSTVDCEKSAQIVSENFSAFHIFSNKYPWMLFKFNALGFSNEYVESLIDTLEIIISAADIQKEEFDDFYNDAIGNVDDTHFESIVNLYSQLVLFYGLDLIKKSELRMATIDKYRSENSNTYSLITSVYPNYLRSINENNISNEDFEQFCEVYDSLLASYGQLDVEDPDFLDSLDNRIYRALDYISSDEKSASLNLLFFKDEKISGLKTKSAKYLGKLFPELKQLFMEDGQQAVSEVVAGLMLLKYAEADLIKKSLKEAWYMKKGLIRLSTVTTSLLDYNSKTSVSMQGNVLEDGGSEVTSRGIVWAEYYNPTNNDHFISSGTGLGEFSEVISGLVENKMYYVRAFANNSKGTAYGNCIEFSSEALTTISEKELSSSFNIFPNPTSGMTTFRFNLLESKSTKLAVLNANGQLILEKYIGVPLKVENQVQLDLSKLENGIYFGRLTIKGSEQISCKFLVTH